MFQTIGRTWKLAKLSFATLMKDKELVLFPIMAFVTIAIIMGIVLAIGASIGSLDRLQALSTSDQAAAQEQGVTIADVTLYVLGFVAVTYAVVFFNAALIAAAVERLRGGDPNVRTGLKAVIPKMHNILGWAIISATVGLILQALRSNTDNMLGRIALALAGGVWAYMTFFVVPILVVRGVGPIQAIKQSGSLFRRTWGEQVTSNFGFGIFYIAAGVIVALPIVLLFALSPIAAIIAGVPLVALAIGAVQATEGIFKAALYEFAAEGRIPHGFEDAGLESAYQPNGGRSAGPRGFAG